jgi:hypothetical protein
LGKATIRSVIETCKLNLIGHTRGLQLVLATLPDHSMLWIDELCAWNWGVSREHTVAETIMAAAVRALGLDPIQRC